MNFIRSTFSPIQQMIAATAIFALVLSNVYGTIPFTGVASATAPSKVTICHATESGDGDMIVYQKIVVSENAIDGHFDNPGTPKSGHEDDLYFLGDDVDCPGDEYVEVPGCTNKDASNYDPKANTDDGSCEYDDEGVGYLKVWKYIVGTTTVSATNFSFTVNGDDSYSFPETGNEWNDYPFVVVEVPLTGSYNVVENAAPGYFTTYALTEDLEDLATEDTLNACKDITLTEEHPYAYCRITNTIDVCPNIDLAQSVIPKGMEKNDAGSCVEIPRCDAGESDWADGYDEVDQKKLKNGNSITDPNRIDPTKVVGVEDWVSGGSTGFFSLGFGGSIVVTFDHYVVNVSGDDLTVYEATNGDAYPAESVKVEVSQDGVVWETLTEAATNADIATRATGLDFDETSFSWIKYVRLTDTSDAAPHTADADGFDLDAVRATKTVCDEPDPETPEYCTVTLVSGTDTDAEDADGYGEDDNTTVVEKSGALAKLLSFVHPAWTAAIAGAEWIWGDDPVQPPVIGASQTFVRTFGWNGTVADAKLYVAADNTYSSTINGDASGAETVDTNNFGSADVYDVDGLIDQGNNTLSINVVNTVGATDPAGNPAGLLYKLVITTEDDVDCDIPYEEEDDTTLTIEKIVAEGSDTETSFTFEVNDALFATLADGESETEIVAPGSYKIEELGVEGWDLTSVSCVDEEKNVVGSEDGAWYLELEEGDDVTCTFVNEEEEDDDSDPKVCRIGENLIQNGSFETPTAPNTGWGIFTPVLGWTITNANNNDGLEIWNDFDGSGAGTASVGEQNAELDGNVSTDISQAIATIPGTVYELSFDFSARAGVAQNSLDARADGNLIVSASADGSSNGGNEWEDYSGTFVATDASTIISFEDTAVSDSLGTLLDNVVLCVTDEVPLYTVDGYKWNDENGNGEWDDEESTLSGWVIEVTNGEDTYATSTDANGYYWFALPEGNWVVTEVQQAGWDQTYPDPEGQNEGACHVYFYEYENPSLKRLDVDDSADDSYGWDNSPECNFGNHQDDEEERELACDISASANEVDEGDDVTIYWSTVLADSATLNGNTVALSGSQVFEDMEEDTTFTLVATDLNDEEEGSASVECSVTIEVDEDGGGSSSSGSRRRSSRSANEPIGEVLGETTSVLPVGAPDTGAGGTSTPSALPLVAVLAMLMSLAVVRATKRG